MLVRMNEVLSRKLQILADAAKYDVSCAASGSHRVAPKGGLGANTSCGVCHSWTPDGRCVSLLKILLTNCCIYDCQYCVNRCSSDTPRVRFEPKELVFLTMEFYRRNYIEGLFLSSGIFRSADFTMEQMVQVVKELREEQGFAGYIHLKAVPGASEEVLRHAGLYADRLSANIELPTQKDLSQLAPQKNLGVIEHAMGEIATRVAESASLARKRSIPRAARPPRFAPAGQSTQMVIGATPSTDQTILNTASSLYHSYNLRRVYYSAYSPVQKAASLLPANPPPLVREHRLYQADWLMRYYDFAVTELTTPQEPNLDLEVDPKMAWALRNRAYFPLDVNKASREQLLRIPGIGVRNVERILRIRRYHRLTLADLAKLRLAMKKIRPFVITADHNPDNLLIDRGDLRQRVTKPYEQLELFAAAGSAVSGEV